MHLPRGDRFPRAADYIASQAPIGTRGNEVKLIDGGLLDEAPSQPQAPSSTLSGASSRLAQPLVLLVDDDLAERLYTQACLCKAGFLVHEAADGEQALAAFTEVQPDIVLCDVLMPGMNGYEVCAAIRRLPGGAHVPIIMLTGLDDVESIERAYAAGATDFSVKPINAPLLPRKVRFILRAGHAVEQLKRSEERYALAACAANDGLWDWDRNRDSVYYSPRWKELLGYADGEVGDHLEEWLSRIHPDDVDCVRSELDAHIEGHINHFEKEHRLKASDGTFRWMLARGLAVRDSSGRVHRMAGSMTDVSKRRAAQEKLEFDALHDPLTRLPNRALFFDRLQHCIELSIRRPHYRFAVLFMDLDRFKIVNDSLGHLIGDCLLIEATKRIRAAIRDSDTLARFGGDEFTILFEDIEDASTVTCTAERIQNALTLPVELAGQMVVTSASMGIALSSPSYRRSEEMLRDADAAMYRAKSCGRARYEIFRPAMHEHAVHTLQTEAELRMALERDEFLVEYQPIISLRTGEVSGFEALVRWQHPSRGLLPPGEFLTVAEETHLIVPIGRKVLQAACGQLRDWQKRWSAASKWTVSVNLASQELTQPDLPSTIDEILRNTGLSPNYLNLEITERSLIENDSQVLEIMRELAARGIQLSIDDFGTGYSSLSYLHRFPFNVLKIDRSFIHDLENQPRRVELVKAIVSLAHNLGLKVVAEGSETADSVQCLKELLCEYAQGYYFGRPQEAKVLSRLFESRYADGEPNPQDEKTAF